MINRRKMKEGVPPCNRHMEIERYLNVEY